MEGKRFCPCRAKSTASQCYSWQHNQIAGNSKKIEFNNVILKHENNIKKFLIVNNTDEYDNVEYDFKCLITKLIEKSD